MASNSYEEWLSNIVHALLHHSCSSSPVYGHFDFFCPMNLVIYTVHGEKPTADNLDGKRFVVDTSYQIKQIQ